MRKYHERGERHFRDREHAEHQRPNDLFAPPNERDNDRKPDADDHTEDVTERHLEEREPEMPPQRAIKRNLDKRARN